MEQAHNLEINLESIRRARSRVLAHAHHTPLLTSHTFSQMAGCQAYLKAENLQRTGSFKIRGASNKIALLTAEQRAKGVIAASAGNHAQGVALAAHRAGIGATIVMPEAASFAKVEATKGYGAHVILHGKSFDEAQEHALGMAKTQGLTFIPAFDDPAVIAGQGTLGLELHEDLPDADAVLIPVGGGGLIAGVAMALKTLSPKVRVIGVQAAAMPAMLRSFQAKERVGVVPAPTVADGIAVAAPGELTFPLIRQYVDEMVSVGEEEITQTMVLLLERAKLLVEGAGAVGLAALLYRKALFPDQRVVVVLSGGNVDAGLVARALEHGLVHAGRYLVLRVKVGDRPGQLARLLGSLAEAGANILEVAHHRKSAHLPLDQVEVEVTMETRGPEHAAKVHAHLESSGYRRDPTHSSDYEQV